MFACQIFETARSQLPGLDDDLARGHFAPLKAWLGEKVHSSGSFHMSGDALMVAVTGRPLEPSVYLKYLTDKYTDIYRL